MDHVHPEGYGSGLHLFCDVTSIRVMTLATHLMINSFTCGLTNAGESSYRETLQIWVCNMLWTRHPAYSLWLKSCKVTVELHQRKERRMWLSYCGSKTWWNYPGLQFPARIIFSTPDFLVPGIWTNPYAFNCFFFFHFIFYSASLSCSFIFVTCTYFALPSPSLLCVGILLF